MRRQPHGIDAETVSFAVGDVLFSYATAGAAESWIVQCDEVRRLVDSIMTGRGGLHVGEPRSLYDFIYVFGRASTAVEALIEVQRTVNQETVFGAPASLIRSAAFSGEVGEHVGFGGSTLDQAVALKELAYAGQIVVSLSSRELARQHIEGAVEFRDLGVHRIHEAAPPQRLFQILADGIPSQFPPIRSVESPYTNIVPAPTSFVGRERELFQMAMQLRGSRLLTITGPSGIGKSRAAVQLARLLTYEYVDGTFLIDFGGLVQPSFIFETIVAQLPFIDISGGNLREALKRQIGRKQMLLVFDNCDLLREPLANEIEELMSDFRGVELIVTSRESLGINQESVFNLPPLDEIGLEGGVLETSQACTLLIDRIRETLPGFAPSESQERDLMNICRRLRGVPLAVELTASKFRGLSSKEVLRQLEEATEDSMSSLSRDLQQLVDQTLEWIYYSLPASDQTVFRKLSAFSDGWETEALSFLCVDLALTPREVEQAEQMLVNRGLVSRIYLGPGKYRNKLTQALWQFSLSKAREAGEESGNRKRYVEWFVGMAKDVSDAILGPDPAIATERTAKELANIRAAIEYSLEDTGNLDPAYKLILGFQRYWGHGGFLTEGRIWLNRVFERNVDEISERRAQLLNILGVFCNFAGDGSSAIPYLEQGLQMARRLKLEMLEAMILANMGVSYSGLKRTDKSAEIHRLAADMFDRLGEHRRRATSLTALGASLIRNEQLEEAMEVTTKALELHREFGQEWLVVLTKMNLAEIAFQMNQMDKAEPLLTEALTQYQRQRDMRGVQHALRSIASVSERLGQSERAVVLLGAAASVRNRLHQDLAETEAANHEAIVDRLTGALGDATFLKRWTEGMSLSPEAAVAYATGSDTPGL